VTPDHSAPTPKPALTADDFAGIMRERDAAHRAYNDALTALDRAIQHLRDLPAPPPAFDEHQISPLNNRWELLSLRRADHRGWLHRVRNHVWAMLAPLFERQQEFNASLVDHINRNAAVYREAAHGLGELLTVCREELARLVAFESTLVQYAQQVTPYVDANDRYAAALSTTLAESIQALSDDARKRWESMAARDRRYQAQVDEVRGTLGVAHHAILTLKRELEQRPAAGAPASADADRAAPPAASLDSYKYVGFEDQFRGSRDDIRDRLKMYVPEFEGRQDVLDIGCGRGEFLDLLREQGISGRGVDLNDEMAAICRSRGLDASAGDALGYLLSLPDASLGGLFASQVVEHLEPGYLMRLLETAFHKLRPGSKIILETVNVACWSAFFSSYIRDITHVRPLHPDTLRYLVAASGFQRVDVRYSAPVPDAAKLRAAPVPAGSGDVAALAAAFNHNVAQLNDLLFTALDYAVVGERS
jgi:SAM-dependent methyltransferase